MEWLNGNGRPTAGQGGSLQEQLRAWRQVATEREQACEELEQINHWLEQENQRLETTLEQLRREKLAVETVAAAAQAAPPLPASPPPTWKRCLAYYVRLALPSETLRGRTVRKGYRLALRLWKRAA